MALSTLPYHYKITSVTGTGGLGNDYVLTFEIHDAAHTIMGTDTCKYSGAEIPRNIKHMIMERVNARAAADAGSVAALITAMVGVDNDMDSAPSFAGAPEWANVQNKPTTFSPSTHSHAQSEVTNLTTDLAGKQTALGYTAENAASKGAANGYASLDSGGKVPSAQLPASGSDPWTYVILSGDFVTSSGTAVDVTGLEFTPSANLRYEIEGRFLLRTATGTVGPRPGCAWPTGMTDGTAWIWASSSATAMVQAFGNVNAVVTCADTGLNNTTQSWPSKLEALLICGASPSGVFKITLLSETAGTNVTMKANSFIRYRTF